MATLVFSTIGTILGGPVGGAIGALIGQSIDEQVLGPSQRGPKVGDLSVQTSSYGTQMPRIFGAMRIAGSVVWSTDLMQSEQTSGAKGQPDTTFSYKVSFAVALSSRRAGGVGRIWADGKLLRGVEGDFKVPVVFRFHDGSEDQTADPLIASLEGIGTTPAYRGLALAVFEDLELAEYGNRIPFLTFELVADDAAPTVGAILNDLSGGAIVADAGRTVAGFAAYGRSMRAAAEPLVQMFDLPLFDDGEVVRAPASAVPIAIDADDLGQSIDGQEPVRIRREQPGVRSLPARLRLRYYDPERDYQSGEARASVGDQAGTESERELPAVITAGEAKALAQQALAGAWLGRERVHISLPPAMAGLEPGSVVALPITPERWRVEKVTVEGFVAAAELKPWSAESLGAVVADAGRAAVAVDEVAGEVVLALVDAAAVTASPTDEPTLYLAASSSGASWKSRTVIVDGGGQSVAVQTARRKAVIGTALGVLGAGSCELVDRINAVEVELVDGDQWLTSCDMDALANGANLAILGDELLQFSSAESLGDGRFRLSGLLRGRGGSEWAVSGHVAGERFVMIDRCALVPLPLPAWAIGSEVAASAVGIASDSLTVGTASIRPLSPVHLTAASSGGGLAIAWTRRSRGGWAWLDEVDAPLGEKIEAYRVTLAGAGATVERSVEQASIEFTASDLDELGGLPWTLEVRQVGDFAVSKPATVTIHTI